MMCDNENKNDIYFFATKGYYGFLSNFYAITFYMEQIEFCCSEQAFVYYKCKYFEPSNENLLHSILQETRPQKIKLLGRKVKNFNEYEWNNVKYNIMLKCVRAKFECNEKYKRLLIKTAPRRLYEASPYDKIWGIGFNSNQAKVVDFKFFGQNLLGKVLEEVRSEFIVQKNF
tara:strand:+ start:215 stop:730 length:516 start_codon:yes stop_codon:yes gene_type:complete